MLGAIYIGLSGMQTYSKGLQIISNNVSNMNTAGFKTTSVSFSDAFNRGGLGSFHAGKGGQSYGSGVQLGGRALDFSAGDMRQSGGDLDIAIKGDGFLVVSDEGRTHYTRTGQFVVNEDSYITLLGGNYRLNVLDASGNPVPVNIDALRTNPPVATQKITFRGNVTADASASQAVVQDIAVHDARGTQQVWKLTLNRAPAEQPPVPNKWIATVTNDKGATLGQPQTVIFDAAGGAPNPATFTVSYTPEGGEPVAVTLDLSDVDNFNSGSTSTIRAAEVDGRGTGALTKVSVNAKGHLELTYTNGQKTDLGAIAIATFRDLQKLEQIGDGLFRNTGAQASVAASDTDGGGVLVSGQIEASNVDLAQQFGDLILIQRGFQASSQVVSVSNDMIQQLFGMRGQG